MAAFGGDENPASAEMYGDFAGVEMTKKFMVDLCMKHDGYRTPHVNDKLYLHQQGFRCIEPSVMGLYTGVRSLWLQQNGLTKIQGLENCVERVEGLEACTKLQTLNVGFNNIGPEAFEIEHVLLPALSTLDVQANGLADGEGELRNYRKRMISEIKTLRYLDDRPVFEDERRRCEAWAGLRRGGTLDAANEAERGDRADPRGQEGRRGQSVRDFENFIADARAAKAADDAAKGLSFSGDRIVDPNRPAGDENADPNGGGATARFDEAAYVDADELD
ncbi:dynein associated LRR protein [Aureococcus anophagefferens]|nr:dynein associated LRR protein [Aureococcus anophagefferens]